MKKLMKMLALVWMVQKVGDYNRGALAALLNSMPLERALEARIIPISSSQVLVIYRKEQ